MKKKKKHSEIIMGLPIDISKKPFEIDISDIKIEQGKCFINSYRVAKKYSNVQIVEGLIMVISENNKAQVFPHVWNKLIDVHFDCTNESIWIGKEAFTETKEVKYISVNFHNHTNFKEGDVFEFSKYTRINEEALNNLLNKKK